MRASPDRLCPIAFPREGRIYRNDSVFRGLLHEAYRGLDFWTGEPLPFDAMHADHVWPVSKGGPDNAYNLVPTARTTNMRKYGHASFEATVFALSILRAECVPKILSGLRRHDAELARGIASGVVGRPWWYVTDESLVGSYKHGYGYKNLPQGDAGHPSEHVFAFMEARRFVVAARLRREGPRWNDLAVDFEDALGVALRPADMSAMWRRICCIRVGHPPQPGRPVVAVSEKAAAGASP